MTLAALALAVVSPLTPFPPGEVTVGGEIGRRMAAAVDCLTQRIDIEKTYLRHFRVRREKPEVWGGFTGWSMALDALVKAAAHGIGGDEMRRFKDKWLRETIATQAADGSISMYSGKPGRWDSHEQAYFLQAFARDAIWFGDADARESGRRLGDFILANDVSVNLGLQSGLLWLFRATGDLRYVDYCRDRYLIEGTNDDYDRILPVNGVAHVYTWLERALAQCEYAAFTGRRSPSLFDSTDEAFRRAFGDCLSVSGTMSGGNHWGEASGARRARRRICCGCAPDGWPRATRRGTAISTSAFSTMRSLPRRARMGGVIATSRRSTSRANGGSGATPTAVPTTSVGWSSRSPMRSSLAGRTASP